jgi:hypothetical protein
MAFRHPTPNPTFQSPSPLSIQEIFNKTIANIDLPLKNIFRSRNMTLYEVKAITEDPGLLEQESLSAEQLFTIFSIIVLIGAIGFIGYTAFVVKKTIKSENIQIPNLIKLVRNVYNEYTTDEVLPKYQPKKAKESPFVGPQMQMILPACPRLDDTEKGKNIVFRFRGPFNGSMEPVETPTTKNETCITIVAVVENNEKPPAPTTV